MEKKLVMQLLGHDIFMNVAGGVKIDEPAVDLAIVAAVASSFLDRPIKEGSVVMGEVGLTGEVRAISHVETRVAECRKMGFNRCLVPHGNLTRMDAAENGRAGIQIIGIKTVGDAMEELF